MLMRLMSKIEYLILPKGMKFTGSGTLWLNTPLEQKLSIFATLPHHMFGVQILQKCMPSTFFSLTITWGVVNCDSNIYRCMFKDALAYQSEFVFPWGEFIETILYSKGKLVTFRSRVMIVRAEFNSPVSDRQIKVSIGNLFLMCT